MKLSEHLTSVRKRFGSKTSDWLVFEFNGFNLRALRGRVDDGALSVSEIILSNKATVDACFTDLLEQLRRQNPTLPSRAILITSQAACSILELPINPFAPYDENELRELVRWEFEQQLTEQLAALTIDTIMVGRGLISEADVDEAREAMLEQNPTTRSVATAPGKFVDQTICMGLLERAQGEECLKILESFQTLDDNFSCKFFPIAKEGAPPGDNGFPWGVCGLAETTRRQWVTRFESHDIRLERIYPIGFTSSAACDPIAPDSSHGVMDLLEGLDCYAAFEGDQLTAIRWGPAPLSPRNPEALINLISGDRLDSLWLSGRKDIALPVATAITDGLKIPVRAFPQITPSLGVASQGSLHRYDGMVGSIRHTAALSERMLPWTEGSGPAPPWFRQASKWWMVVGVLVGLLVGGTEVSLAIRKHSIQWKIDQVKGQVDQVRGEIAKVEGQSKAISQLLSEIETATDTLESARTSYSLVNSGIALRQEYAISLLFTLAGSVNGSIAVNEFSEDQDHLVHIKAWSISEKESQKFVRAMVQQMAQWGLSVDRQEVKSGPGRMGLSGYDIELTLRPNPSYIEKS